MKSQIALIALLASSAAAFSPKPFVTPSKSLVTSSSDQHPGLWTPPKRNLEMVAGGAEKAYGEEYYDGK
jgi:hypothetical protein